MIFAWDLGPAISSAPCDLRVEGAGLVDVDGRYYRVGEADGVPYYAQRGSHGGEGCNAVVSWPRCPLSFLVSP